MTERLLTEAELELMTILWDRGPSTVRNVLESLPAERDLAYTSVATLLHILDEKGFASSHKEGRRLVYAAAVERAPYEARNLRHLVGRLFGGNPVSLVRRLVASDELDEDDLRAMQALLDARLEDE